MWQLFFGSRHHFDSDLYRCQMCLAGRYHRNGNLSQSLRSLEAALKIAIKMRDKQLQSDTLTTKAMVHVYLLSKMEFCVQSLRFIKNLLTKFT